MDFLDNHPDIECHCGTIPLGKTIDIGGSARKTQRHKQLS
jgi:hypothetical protein